jgi:multicomponent Na+:H+ antiporter subunit E
MFVSFLTFFLGELVLSTVRVAWEVITPDRKRRPGIIVLPLDARTETEIAVLANLITLTPGTLSLDVSSDRRELYVHALFVDDPDQLRAELKQQFERRVLALLREAAP